MKDCPRCGSQLSHYALAEGEAYGCDSCGWVGVDVEHRSKPVKLESWHDAIARFESKFVSKQRDDVVTSLERVRDEIDVPDDDPERDPEPTVDRVPNDESTPDHDEPVPEAQADEPEPEAQADQSESEERTDDTSEETAADESGTDDATDEPTADDATDEPTADDATADDDGTTEAPADDDGTDEAPADDVDAEDEDVESDDAHAEAA